MFILYFFLIVYFLLVILTLRNIYLTKKNSYWYFIVLLFPLLGSLLYFYTNKRNVKSSWILDTRVLIVYYFDTIHKFTSVFIFQISQKHKIDNPQKLSFFNANKFLLLQLSYNLNRSNVIIFTPSIYREIEYYHCDAEV